MKPVKAKWVKNNPSFAGLLLAALTIVTTFSVLEEKTIKCGKCKHVFTKTCRDSTNRAKCKACKRVNIWELWEERT